MPSLLDKINTLISANLHAIVDRATGLPVGTGRFQQRMDVELVNAGPVTIMLDSRDKFPRE